MNEEEKIQNDAYASFLFGYPTIHTYSILKQGQQGAGGLRTAWQATRKIP